MYEFYVAKGDTVMHVNLRRAPLDRDTLVTLLLGVPGARAR